MLLCSSLSLFSNEMIDFKWNEMFTCVYPQNDVLCPALGLLFMNLMKIFNCAVFLLNVFLE